MVVLISTIAIVMVWVLATQEWRPREEPRDKFGYGWIGKALGVLILAIILIDAFVIGNTPNTANQASSSSVATQSAPERH